MYDRMTNVNGLHNLIWEFTSSDNAGYQDWYPGDSEVDIVSVDIYGEQNSNMSGQWTEMLSEYNGRKMIALSETGSIPDPDQMDAYGIDWSYFSPWGWDFIVDRYLEAGYTQAQITAILQKALASDDIITLDELPGLPWKVVPGVPGDYNGDGTVDAADYCVWRDSFGQTGPNLAADGDGSGQVDGVDYDIWRWNFGTSASGTAALSHSAPVPEPASAALLLLAAGALAIAATRRRDARSSI